MMKEALHTIDNLFQKRPIFFCILVAVIILAIDYYTGKFIRFPIFYIIPIWMAAWWNQKRAAYVLAILLPLVRVGFHFPMDESEQLYSVLSNTLIRILALIIYAYFILRFKASEMKVKRLEGILPICSSCKRIRNEEGEYEQMESYITDHSKALFSHGLCQDCAQKMYAEFINKK